MCSVSKPLVLVLLRCYRYLAEYFMNPDNKIELDLFSALDLEISYRQALSLPAASCDRQLTSKNTLGHTP
jgi:hypothetical protein